MCTGSPEVQAAQARAAAGSTAAAPDAGGVRAGRQEWRSSCDDITWSSNSGELTSQTSVVSDSPPPDAGALQEPVDQPHAQVTPDRTRPGTHPPSSALNCAFMPGVGRQRASSAPAAPGRSGTSVDAVAAAAAMSSACAVAVASAVAAAAAAARCVRANAAVRRSSKRRVGGAVPRSGCVASVPMNTARRTARAPREKQPTTASRLASNRSPVGVPELDGTQHPQCAAPFKTGRISSAALREGMPLSPQTNSDRNLVAGASVSPIVPNGSGLDGHAKESPGSPGSGVLGAASAPIHKTRHSLHAEEATEAGVTYLTCASFWDRPVGMCPQVK